MKSISTVFVADKSFILKGVLFLIISALIIIIEQQFTGLDITLAELFYDANVKGFYWKNHWMTQLWMHDYLKKGLILFGVTFIAWVVVDMILRKGLTHSQLLRFRMRFVAIAALLIPTVIAWLKHNSILHCPWSLTPFGGHAPYMRLFSMLPEGVIPGHCFPAGHVTTSLWLIALCVFWLPEHPVKAQQVVLFGMGLSFLLGWFQQMRGAHFLSHTLWSLWIGGSLLFVMLAVAFRK